MAYTNNDMVDPLKAAAAVAVIKAKLLETGLGDRFINDTVEVLGVLKNESSYKFPAKIHVAHYADKQGVALNKECILYLIPFPLGAKELNDQREWMLLNGDASYGCDYK